MTNDPKAMAATLSWGLKQSFVAYVEGAGGAIATGEGAARNPEGGFTFAATPGEGLRIGADGKPEGSARFVGEVSFEAHGGMLKVFLADPSVEIGPAGAVLAVADTRKRDRRVTLAQLDMAAAAVGDDGVWAIPAKLSLDGWQVMGDHYPPFTPLDPVRLTLG